MNVLSERCSEVPKQYQFAAVYNANNKFPKIGVCTLHKYLNTPVFLP